MDTTTVQFDLKEIARFCREHHVRKLSLFGSALRGDFTLQSDVDLLVEFLPGRSPGLITFAGMELKLSAVFGGRKVDLNTAGTLSPYFYDEVAAEAKVIYEQA